MACGVVGGEYEAIALLVVGVEAGCTIWLSLARYGGESEHMMTLDEICKLSINLVCTNTGNGIEVKHINDTFVEYLRS